MGLFGGGGGEPLNNSAPAIGALHLQTSSLGGVLPIVYGHTRVPGNLIWYNNFQAIPHTTTTTQGGKGGGEVTSTNTTYTYQAAIAMAICEGPITFIPGVWRGKEYHNLGEFFDTQFAGNYPQAPWSGFLNASGGASTGTLFFVDSNGNVITSSSPLFGPLLQYWLAHGAPMPGYTMPGQAAAITVSYPGVAYTAAATYQLTSNAELPNHNFDVMGRCCYGLLGIYDACPADFVLDFLTNSHYGAGFPAAKIAPLDAGAASFKTYCIASGTWMSPALTEARPAAEYLTEWLQAANSACWFSEGLLKIAPYADQGAAGNGYTFTPNTTPLYDLTDDDFLTDGSHDPITVTRVKPADAFNKVQIEISNRANAYNAEIIEAWDQYAIDTFGLRTMPVVKQRGIVGLDTARVVAQRILQRAMYVRTTYEFKVSTKYSLLEPMDLVTLTDPQLGLSLTAVRIISIEEDREELTITAEEYPAGVATATAYPVTGAAGYQANYNVDPGNTNAPVVIDVPAALTTSASGLELWLAASGGPNWGGCQVWASLDGNTYQWVATVNGPARQGVLTAALASGSDPDTVNSLAVDLTMSSGQLTSGTKADADALRTLCYAGGEIMAYESATLTGPYAYTLGYLRRGVYGTPITSHNAGVAFARLDGAVVKYPYTSDMIGKPLYLKLLSFNRFQRSTQLLANVQPVTVIPGGFGLTSAPSNVTNVVSVFRSGRTWLTWDPVTDPRGVTYEVRVGSTWAKGAVVSRPLTPEFVVPGNGTFWIAALAGSAYSASPTSIVISGATLTANVVATWDEAATSWTGTLGGGAAVVSSTVRLTGSALVSAAASMSGISPSVAAYGGIAASGSYEIPAGHIVDIGTAQPCQVTVSYTLTGDSPYALFSALPLVSQQGNIAGNYSPFVNCTIQIALADNSGVFGAWQTYVPGVYTARKFKCRALLTSSDPTVTAILSSLVMTVDMPDRVERGTGLSVAAGGAAVTFTTPFQVTPNVQITITNAVAGDDVFFTAGPSTTGFTVQVKNGGVGVARTVNWLAQGY